MKKEEQLYKEIPIGTGRESEPKETLPAIEVDNEVIWVNPEFKEMPFKLEEGEPAKLGLFLTPKLKEREKSFDLKVMPGHGRTGLVGRAIFKDNDGRLYRDIDLKGMGKVEFKKSKPQVGRVEESPLESPHNVEGVLSCSDAQKAIHNAEEFLDLGIRTERYLALIDLKEIIDENGKKISIKDSPIYGKGPRIGVRALGTKHRIFGINDATLTDAKMLVAQEMGEKEKKFSWHDYLKWFSKTLGENVGLMHKNNYLHRYLLNHNITLDCRIIDLGSIIECHDLNKASVDTKREMRGEWYKTSHGALKKLFKKVSPKDKACKDFKDYLNYFNEVYIKTLGYAPEFLRKDKKQKNK